MGSAGNGTGHGAEINKRLIGLKVDVFERVQDELGIRIDRR